VARVGIYRRRPQEDCGKPARGSTPFCGAHAGGRCCGQPGCRKVALTGSLLCMQHALLQRPCDAQGCSGSTLCAQHLPWQGHCTYLNCAKGAMEVSAMRCTQANRHAPPVKSLIEGFTFRS